MTLQEAQDLLKVRSTDDFDTIMRAKNKQVAKVDGDQEKIFMIEAAYDLLLMQNMRARLTGEMKVSNNVRFADVPAKKTVKQVQQSMLSKLPGGGVSISLPPNDQLAVQVGVFSALVLWAFIQGATEPWAAQQGDVAGLQLALAFGAAVYFLREKKRLGLGRSFAYAASGLLLGSILGNAVEAWLRVDIVPLAGMGSPGILVGEFGIFGIAAATILLA